MRTGKLQRGLIELRLGDRPFRRCLTQIEIGEPLLNRRGIGGSNFLCEVGVGIVDRDLENAATNRLDIDLLVQLDDRRLGIAKTCALCQMKPVDHFDHHGVASGDRKFRLDGLTLANQGAKAQQATVGAPAQHGAQAASGRLWQQLRLGQVVTRKEA